MDKNEQNFSDEVIKKEQIFSIRETNQDTKGTQKLACGTNKDLIERKNLVHGAHHDYTEGRQIRIHVTNHVYRGNKNLGHETNQDSLKILVIENNHNYKKKEQKFGLRNKSREHRREKLVHGINYE
jgi:hypothetical protein